MDLSSTFTGSTLCIVCVQSLNHFELFGTPWTVIHGVTQVRTLEWFAIPSSGGIFLTQGSNLCLFCLMH